MLRYHAIREKSTRVLDLTSLVPDEFVCKWNRNGWKNEWYVVQKRSDQEESRPNEKFLREGLLLGLVAGLVVAISLPRSKETKLRSYENIIQYQSHLY